MPRRATSGPPPPFRNGLARQSPFITRNSPPFEEGGIRSIPAAPLRSPPSWRSKKNSSRTAITRSKPNSLSFLPSLQCISVYSFFAVLSRGFIRQTSSTFSLLLCGMPTVSLTARPYSASSSTYYHYYYFLSVFFVSLSLASHCRLRIARVAFGGGHRITREQPRRVL